MRSFFRFFPLWILLLVVPAVAWPAGTATTPALLPQSFSGWQKTEHHNGTASTQVDVVNAALLNEFGFTDYELATYERAGRKLHLKAARFSNATGSFGAFTLFTSPDMLAQAIANAAFFTHARSPFSQPTTLTDPSFQTPT